MEIHPLAADRIGHLAGLFETNGTTRGCWCMFFLVTGKELERGWGATNRARFEEFAAAQDPPAGLLAYRDGEPVGWCAMGPRSRYPRALRGHVLDGRDPGEDEDVWLLPCFFVRRAARRQGVTRELIAAVLARGQRHGATAVEAFPLAGDGRHSSGEAYLGTEPLFASCGFTRVASPTPRRVVMRKTFPEPHPGAPVPAMRSSACRGIHTGTGRSSGSRDVWPVRCTLWE